MILQTYHYSFSDVACKQANGEPERSLSRFVRISCTDRFAHSSVSRSPNFFLSTPGACLQAILMGVG